jgi:hypothetical protein
MRRLRGLRALLPMCLGFGIRQDVTHLPTLRFFGICQHPQAQITAKI